MKSSTFDSVMLSALFGGLLMIFISFVWAMSTIQPVKVNTSKPTVHQTNTVPTISKLIPQLDPSVCKLIAVTIDKYSKQSGIKQDTIIRVIYKESSFNIIARSKKDCLGLMQINPIAHRDKIGNLSFAELYHVENNIRIGCMILGDCINSSKTMKEAMCKYEGRKYASKY
jgi:hypothetical protein